MTRVFFIQFLNPFALLLRLRFYIFLIKNINLGAPGNTVVKHSTHNPKVKYLNPSTGKNRDEVAINVKYLFQHQALQHPPHPAQAQQPQQPQHLAVNCHFFSSIAYILTAGLVFF